MVGNYDVNTTVARSCRGFKGRDTAVYCNNELRPQRFSPFKAGSAESVAVLYPVRNKEMDLKSVIPQALYHYSRCRHAVGVVITMDEYPLSIFFGYTYPFSCGL